MGLMHQCAKFISALYQHVMCMGQILETLYCKVTQSIIICVCSAFMKLQLIIKTFLFVQNKPK